MPNSVLCRRSHLGTNVNHHRSHDQARFLFSMYTRTRMSVERPHLAGLAFLSFRRLHPRASVATHNHLIPSCLVRGAHTAITLTRVGLLHTSTSHRFRRSTESIATDNSRLNGSHSVLQPEGVYAPAHAGYKTLDGGSRNGPRVGGHLLEGASLPLPRRASGL